MRIVSWNLGHQTLPRAIKPGFCQVIASLRPDVLFLNEYVHDDKLRAPLLGELKQMGLQYCRVSEHICRPAVKPEEQPKRNNQVLAVARVPLRTGDLRGPATHDRGGETNFLHVQLEGVPFEIAGVRAPAYNGSALKAYWDAFATLAAQVSNRAIVFVGDFNGDPEQVQYVGGSVLASLRNTGWQLPAAEGPWSFKSGTRIVGFPRIGGHF